VPAEDLSARLSSPPHPVSSPRPSRARGSGVAERLRTTPSRLPGAHPEHDALRLDCAPRAGVGGAYDVVVSVRTASHATAPRRGKRTPVSSSETCQRRKPSSGL
jgi:hypothetical protein